MSRCLGTTNSSPGRTRSRSLVIIIVVDVEDKSTSIVTPTQLLDGPPRRSIQVSGSRLMLKSLSSGDERLDSKRCHLSDSIYHTGSYLFRINNGNYKGFDQGSDHGRNLTGPRNACKNQIRNSLSYPTYLARRIC